jgi:hypothetical protein
VAIGMREAPWMILAGGECDLIVESDLKGDSARMTIRAGEI